jgi:hypothetical protein
MRKELLSIKTTVRQQLIELLHDLVIENFEPEKIRAIARVRERLPL